LVIQSVMLQTSSTCWSSVDHIAVLLRDGLERVFWTEMRRWHNKRRSVKHRIHDADGSSIGMKERVVDADSSVVLVQLLSKATVVRVVDHAVVAYTCSLRLASCPRRELNVAHRIRRYRRLKFLDLSDVAFRRRLQKFVVLDDPSGTPISIHRTTDTD
jgi:hypothetical protein